jgi:hypothetical protein
LKLGHKKVESIYMKLGTSMQPLSSADKDKGNNLSPALAFCVYM